MTHPPTVEMPEKMPLTGLDIAGEKREALRQALAHAFPEVFAEGRIDFDQLKRVLGDWVDSDRERFGLNWPGKAACMKVIQAPSVGTLKPCREESVDWDATQNLFIEGDNLEVLKLLQKAYFGKVKMIYIDPPYNTGKEFIYPDKYAETLDTYLEYTGQKDGNGRKFTTNTDTNGRFHSRWLNMMYPRLYLAKNLLREDGVIFISIDDNEQANLKALCDQIFGEENFIANLVWKSRASEDTRAKTGVSTDHEYILCYRRSDIAALRGAPKDLAKFSNPDNDSRGSWRSADLTGLAAKDQRPNLHYDLINPETRVNYGCPPKGWRYDPTTMTKKIEERCILWPPSAEGRPRHKLFLEEMDTIYKNMSSVLTSFTTADGTRQANQLLGDGIFSFPKPVDLPLLLAGQVTTDEDLILDFFAGSGSTAEAVFRANVEDGSRRHFIAVQLPEPIEEGSMAHEKGYTNIASISRGRIRLAGKALKEANTEQQLDFGFRSYKLDTSCFKQWDGDIAGLSEEQLILRLKEYAQHLDDKAGAEDILYELLLKDGFELTVPIQKLTLAGKEVFSIAEGALLICLERALTQEVMDAMAALDPARVIVLDAGFQNNDQLKANAVQTFKARARDKETAIVFRTV